VREGFGTACRPVREGTAYPLPGPVGSPVSRARASAARIGAGFALPGFVAALQESSARGLWRCSSSVSGLVFPARGLWRCANAPGVDLCCGAGKAARVDLCCGAKWGPPPHYTLFGPRSSDLAGFEHADDLLLWTTQDEYLYLSTNRAWLLQERLTLWRFLPDSSWRRLSLSGWRIEGHGTHTQTNHRTRCT
jgi:hypothetical protein